jgi:hypothetical protein
MQEHGEAIETLQRTCVDWEKETISDKTSKSYIYTAASCKPRSCVEKARARWWAVKRECGGRQVHGRCCASSSRGSWLLTRSTFHPGEWCCLCFACHSPNKTCSFLRPDSIVPPFQRSCFRQKGPEEHSEWKGTEHIRQQRLVLPNNGFCLGWPGFV